MDQLIFMSVLWLFIWLAILIAILINPPPPPVAISTDCVFVSRGAI